MRSTAPANQNQQAVKQRVGRNLSFEPLLAHPLPGLRTLAAGERCAEGTSEDHQADGCGDADQASDLDQQEELDQGTRVKRRKRRRNMEAYYPTVCPAGRPIRGSGP